MRCCGCSNGSTVLVLALALAVMRAGAGTFARRREREREACQPVGLANQRRCVMACTPGPATATAAKR